VRLLILPGLFPLDFLLLVGLLSRVGYIPEAPDRLEPVETRPGPGERLVFSAYE
jgi:hypothetical protein